MKNLFLIICLALFSSIVFGQSKTFKQAKTKFATSTDGLSIAYNVYGSGSQTIVFVHGWSCDKSYWKEQVEPFSKDYRVVTIDLGGHGESDLGRKDWTIYSFGTDVAAVVKELDLEKIILVGHSMGVDVIVDAALQLPGRVSGIVGVDGLPLGPGMSMEQIQGFIAPIKANFTEGTQGFVRGMLFTPEADNELVDYVANDMSSAPPQVGLSAFESVLIHTRQITHDLHQLNIPVIAIYSDKNPTPIDEAFHKSHSVDIQIMPNTASHFIMMGSDAKPFNELLAELVKEL